MESLGDTVQRVEVVGRERLALEDGRVDFDLVQPAGVSAGTRLGGFLLRDFDFGIGDGLYHRRRQLRGMRLLRRFWGEWTLGSNAAGVAEWLALLSARQVLPSRKCPGALQTAEGIIETSKG